MSGLITQTNLFSPYEAFFTILRKNKPLDKGLVDYEKLRKGGLDEYSITSYLNDENNHQADNVPLFKRPKIVEKDLYEVQLLNSTIEHREPLLDF